MGNRIKQRKHIHLKNFDYKGGFIYFVTICTAQKQTYFLNDRVAKVILDELQYRRTVNEIRLFCYCIMPDHIHILLQLGEAYQKNLQNWVSAFKRYTSRVANELFEIQPLWQKNFYDHIVRKEESLLGIAEYILNNPVRKGLVSGWKHYPYSIIVDTIL